MSKPIDQERADFEAWYLREIAVHPSAIGKDSQGHYESDTAMAAWAGWQARASVQPAGVAVPEGLYSITCWSCRQTVSLDDRADADGSCPHCRVELDLEEYLRAMLAAPHPVSGERKADALRKRFSDIEDEIMAGKHNAASVFTAMRTAALYIGQPAAQDVAGLVEALEEIADPIKFMRARLEDGEQLNGVYAIQMAESGNYLREIANRAQQGEQS